MRKCWELSVLMPCVGLMILFNATCAIAGSLGAVQNIHAVSGHEINRPTQETIIEMIWSLPDGYTQSGIEGYYYSFDTLSEEEFGSFNEENTFDLELIRNQTAISEDYSTLNPDDLYVYFHVAAVALNEEEEPIYGTTQTVGPLRIDIIAPKNVWVSALEETSSRSIELSLGAESTNIEIYISNLGYGESGNGWEPFVSSKNWIITEGEGEKSIYVEFRDDAGNISKASTTTVFKTSDPLIAQHSCGLYLPGSELLVSNSIAYTGTFTAINYLMTLPQGWQMSSSSVDSSNYTVLENGNVEFSWNNLTTQETGENLPFTTTITVPYGESGDKQIQSLVTYKLTDVAQMNEYAQPDPLIVSQKEQFYTMTVQYGDNGIINPVGPVVVSHGESVIFSISPEEGYEIDQFIINDQSVSISDNEYIIAHAVENVNIDVTFKRIEFEVSVNVGEKGDVQPDDTQIVYYGGNLEFQITPDKGYRIDTILLNDAPVQITQNTLKIVSIKKDYTIDVTFEKIPETISAIHETNTFFIPGEEIEVDLKINFTGFLTALGYEVQLPKGFSYKEVNSVIGSQPEVQFNTLNNTLSFAWVSLESESIFVKYLLTSPEDFSGKINLLGDLKYRFTDQSEVKESSTITSQAVAVYGEHTNLTGPYEAGTDISIANTIEYTGNIPSLTLEVNIPDGWEYVSIDGSTIPDNLPAIGEQNKISFQWTSLTEKISFKYTVKAGDTSTGTVEVISNVIYTHEGIDLQSNMLPKQLFIEPVYFEATQDALNTYVKGIPFNVNNNFVFNGDIEDLEYHVVIPDGWIYTGTTGESVPDVIDFSNNEIDFSWNETPESPVKFTYSLIPGDYTPTSNTISGIIGYKRNGIERTTSTVPDIITVTEGVFLVTHSFVSQSSSDIAWYTPGQELVIKNSIIYSEGFKIDDDNPNRLAALGYRVGLPDGWEFKSNTGGMIPQAVSYGVEFSWAMPPDSPVNFTYTIKIPESASGTAEIPAMAVYRIGDESQGENIERAQPDPLILYNVKSPTVSISSSLNSPTQSNAIPITVTFSKPVSGFKASDIEVTNGIIKFFTGKDAIYTFIVTPDQEGMITVKIPENSAVDMVGSGNDASELFEIIVDQTRPTVNISSDLPNYVNTTPWEVTISYSEKVEGFSKDDIIISNGTVQSIDDSGNPVFIINVIPTKQGNVEISIPQNVASDIAGNLNYESIEYIRTFDNIPPELTLNGSDDVRIEVGETYIDQGAKAIDQIDGNISDQIQVDNQVNDQSVGVYKVFYEVSDRAGNEQTAERTVHVEPDQITPTVQTDSGGYLPGNDYIVSVTIRFKKGCTAMGYELILPDKWGFDSVWGGNVPDVIRLDNYNKLNFAWTTIKSLESVSFSYAIKIPEDTKGIKTLPATLMYRYADQGELQVDATIQAQEQSIIAIHSSKDVYIQKNAVPIDVNIYLSKDAYEYNEFTAIGLIVHLPDSWTFDRAYGQGAPISTETGIVPEKGDTGVIQFAWFTILNNTISFTYDVIPPEGANTDETITSTVKYRFANGIERSANLLPYELVLTPASLSISQQTISDYIPNMEIPVNTVITYTGKSDTLSNMQLSVPLPTGWSITNIGGVGQPQNLIMNGSTALLKWTEPVPSSPIVFSYDLIPDGQSDQVSILTTLTYNRFETLQTKKPNPILLSKGDFIAYQSMQLPSAAGIYYYTPGENIQIENSVLYSGDLSSSEMRYIINLPDSWSFVDSSLSNYHITSGGQLIFEWEQTPSSPIKFSYKVSVPSNDTGKRTISSTVEYLNGSKIVQVQPNPLVAIDCLPPVPHIQSSLNEVTAISPMEITLYFSKPVLGFEKDDILLQNALIDGEIIQVNDYTFKFKITPINQGEVIVNLPANSVTDYIGNGNNSLSPPFIKTYDSVAPEIVYLGTSVPSTTNSGVIPVTLIINEPVAGFVSSDIIITNGHIEDFQKDGTTYKFNLIPDAQGDVSIRIDSGVLKDNAGNSNSIQQSLPLVYDSIRPSVELSVDPDVRTINMVQPITLTVEMTELVSNFNQEDIVIENGMITNYQIKYNDKEFQAIIQPQGCGYLTISVPENVASDSAGNMNMASENIQLTINCTTYSVRVKDNKYQPLENVKIDVVYPEGVLLTDVKEEPIGKYSFSLPKLLHSEKYFFTLEKEDYVFEDTTFSWEPDPPDTSIGFVVELKIQKMQLIAEKGYEYTITGKVTAEGQDIDQIANNPIVSVYTVHSDMEGKATKANEKGEYFIGFDTIPTTSFKIVASMKDHYIEKEINPLDLSDNVDLDLKLIDVAEDISLDVSVDFATEIEVTTHDGKYRSSVNIPPDTIDTTNKSFKAEVKVHKVVELKPIKLASKLLEVKIDEPVKEGKSLEINLKISDETTEITKEDFISGKYYIFYAETVEAFIAGIVKKVPYTDILEFGSSIKFKVGHLTVFGIGQEQDIEEDLPRLKDEDGSQRRCFISTVQLKPFNSLYFLIILTIMIGAFGLTRIIQTAYRQSKHYEKLS